MTLTAIYPYLLILTTGISVAVAFYAYKTHDAPGVKQFSWMMIAAAEWATMGALEYLVSGFSNKIFFSQLSYIGIIAIPPLWILLVIEYTQQGEKILTNFRRLLWIIPAITLVMVFTNHLHNLQWRGFSEVIEGGKLVIKYEHGLWFWIHSLYNYSLIIGGILALGWGIVHYSTVYRRQSALMFAGGLFPWLGNIAYIFGLTDHTDFTPILFALSGILFFIAYSKFKLFTLRPVTRGNLMNNISDGVLILDINNQIADINRTALEIFELPNENLVGRHISNVFSGWADLLQKYQNAAEAHDEIVTTSTQGNLKHLDIKISSLNYRKQMTGRVIVVRDITESKMSENALWASQALYHALVENLSVAIFRKNLDGRYTFVNRAYVELTGRSAEDILGKTDSEVFEPKLAWTYYQSDQKVIKSHEKIETEEETDLPDKGRCLVRVVKTPIINEDGKLTGIQGMFWDITDLKDKEEQLRQNAEQLATLNRTMQALSSTLDLQGVLETILSELQKVVPYDSASIFEVKGEYLEMVSGRGFPNLGELLGLRFRLDDETTPSTVVMRTRAPYILEDAPQLYSGFKEEKHARAQIRGWMGVPLIFGNDVLGMLALDKHVAGFYNDEHARSAMAFATQAAIAVQNARLYTRVKNSLNDERRHAQRQSTLVRLSEILAELTDEQDIWQKSADGLYNPHLGYSSITMLDWDAATGEKTILGQVGKHTHTELRIIPSGKGLSERAILTGRVIYTPDVSKELDYVPGVGHGCEADIPIWIEDKIAGVISIESDELDAFNTEDLEIFVAAANQIGLALSKARLVQQQQAQLEEIRSLETQLREQAMRDALTGLYSRRYLNDSLSRELAYAQRQEIELSVIMLDIDHFKKINDTYGHKVGDIVLVTLGDMIKNHVRGGDIPCRYGGEEFVILLPGASIEITQQRAESFRAMFEKQRITTGELSISATISLGVATYPHHGKNLEEVLNEADMALYAAKQAGRNCVRIAYE